LVAYIFSKAPVLLREPYASLKTFAEFDGPEANEPRTFPEASWVGWPLLATFWEFRVFPAPADRTRPDASTFGAPWESAFCEFRV
jgi:hypothetical protein